MHWRAIKANSQSSIYFHEDENQDTIEEENDESKDVNTFVSEPSFIDKKPVKVAYKFFTCGCKPLLEAHLSIKRKVQHVGHR